LKETHAEEVGESMNEKNWMCVKTVNEWMDREDLPEGYTMLNAKYRRDFNRIAKALRVQNAFLYFLGVVMDTRYVTKMMWSAKKQSLFCDAVANELNHKRVEPEHAKVFDKNVKQLEKRLVTIDRITKEDIRLTKYHPFFVAEIYGKDLGDFDFESLKPMADKWNEEHPAEVEKHMAEIQPELERYEKFKERKRNSIKAEKEERKAKKKAETAYVNELKKNRQKHIAEQKRLDKSFETYYR
jgi:hypothetical protein